MTGTWPASGQAQAHTPIQATIRIMAYALASRK